LLFALFSCEKKDDDSTTGTVPVEHNYDPGVVITLDDDYVDNWVLADDILAAYQWKATFFVTKCNRLSTAKIEKLQGFKNYGHEIAGHGLNHLNALQFVKANGSNAYVSQEIDPMVSFMDDNALHTTSFAYPFGARDATTDNVLLKKFKILRGTTYGKSDPAYQYCYYTGNKVVYGLGLDNSYAHFSVPYFLSLLEYAKNNHKIVVFYAHKPVETSQNDYETEYQTLIEICQYVKAHNMRFYTMTELVNL